MPENVTDPVFEKKNVEYQEYVKRQGLKANNPEKRKILIKKIPNRIKKFERFFTQAEPFLVPGKMLCLGARTGCENKAANNLGYNALGIDLYPLDPVVIKADWHDIPFDDGSFDNVYTNAIDHCFDVQKLAKEVRRVLKYKGRFFFQTSKKQMLKTKEDREQYISASSNFLFWDDGMSLAKHLTQFGFEIMADWYEGKWESFILEAV